MVTGSITKQSVDETKPTDRDVYLWDQKLSGFGLKVTPAGGKTYLFQYRIGGRGNPTRRYTIGKHGPLTPDQARARAKGIAALVEQGIDPREQEREAKAAEEDAKRKLEEKTRLEGELSFEKVAARWLDYYENEKGRRPLTVAQARHVVKRHLVPALSGKPLPHITRTELQPILDAIPIKHKASRCAVYAYASSLFRWAMERGEIADNPVRLMSKPPAPKARNRVLTDDELASIWKATRGLRRPLSAFYRLLILTGQRREEVASMNWIELDQETATWTIPAERAKNGVAHIVPLSISVLDELDELAGAKEANDQFHKFDRACWPKIGPVITLNGTVSIKCFSKAKRALDAEVEKVRKDKGSLPAWRVHDLRRTLATGLQRIGVRFEVTEAVLNHVSGAKSGVAGIYQQHDWKVEKRSALDAWAQHIATITNHTGDKDVVLSPLKA